MSSGPGPIGNNSTADLVHNCAVEQEDGKCPSSAEDMRRRIQEGWDSLRRGEGVDGEEFMAELELELNSSQESSG